MATGVSTSTSDVIRGLHRPGDITIPRDPVEHRETTEIGALKRPAV